MKYMLYAFCLWLSIPLNAQNTATLKVDYGVEDPSLRQIMDFENISVHRVELNGDNLVDKNYVLTLEEYTKGRLKGSTLLFDSSEANAFKIKRNSLSFTVISKITERNEFKIELYFNGFRSKKSYFDLKITDYAYALKDFLGAQQEIDVPLDGFSILALITPTVHADGSTSYCEVAQSNVAPEALGEEYQMPQNFLLKMKIE
ncbi:hypothetical protein [Pareuzebyella sediminis]|uniref:hypothetical protein n=1 Tax=Pareuzebyella sediminis TaxID=2607998 RepID=UPI0011EDB8FF|nr:hypothetical protein [Pareuzebyella sediminis]